MNNERFFLDTAYVQALLNRRDQHHERAKELFPRVRTAEEIWTTEAVLIEIGNALSGFDRQAAAHFIEGCYQTDNIYVISVDTVLLERALQLYRDRPDKQWGLTDCVSFVAMQDQYLTTALTLDNHFRQAGFQVLMA